LGEPLLFSEMLRKGGGRFIGERGFAEKQPGCRVLRLMPTPTGGREGWMIALDKSGAIV
jgi:hypothetical protein